MLVLDDADADDRRVKRDFPAQKINQKWYGDGTEIKTGLKAGETIVIGTVVPTTGTGTNNQGTGTDRRGGFGGPANGGFVGNGGPIVKGGPTG